MAENKNIIKSVLLFLAGSFIGVFTGFAQLVSHFPMELEGDKIVDSQTGKSFLVNSNLAPEQVDGAEGKALRLDGYSTYVAANIDVAKLSTKSLTFSLWCAMETYPMMNNDEAVNTSTYLAGNMDEGNKSGFAFLLSSQGDYSFDFYVSGWKVTCKANEKLEKYVWNHLMAVVDVNKKEVSIYRNSELVGSASIRLDGEITVGGESFIIGKSFSDIKSGPFLLNTINGLIDDIRIYNTALSVSESGYKTPEHEADLSIPESRFENDILRPVFHGMPGGNWTNEPHGLVFQDGKYHLFFQKNANGPYWGRLHWGHITSENLYDWKEDKIALSPSADYDWKGCWSGCVFNDAVLTGGEPHLFYTAVDNAKATIAEAYPVDGQLTDWMKVNHNPIIPGKPVGLSDDFRDPYIFSANGEFYMIVGTSSDGIGAATLHRYDKATKNWSNDGSLFFKGRNASISGTFWEMPVIVPMNDGKWLFMATPLGSRQGVEVLYWVGTIGNDGTFTPLPAYQNEPREMELSGMGKDGYGLLSPSLYQIEVGKYAAIGIVPDKLSSEANYTLGWAHTFSLPRELTLDENNQLSQKPYGGLSKLRTKTTHSATDFDLNGTRELTPVVGRCLEAQASFKVNSISKVGFRFFKKDDKAVEVYYNPLLNKVVVDARTIDRLKNDEGSFDGLYESILPAKVAVGSEFNLHVYVDHSIMDIFINEKWAFSVRLFPTDPVATGVEVFSDGGNTTFSSLNAWILDPKNKGDVGIMDVDTVDIELKVIGSVLKYGNLPVDALLSFYDFSGRMLARNRVTDSNGTIQLPFSGSCIVHVIGSGVNYSEKITVNN